MKKLLTIFILIIGFIICAPKTFAENIKFIQVTDSHMAKNSEYSQKVLKATIEDINRQDDVDFVVFTGDNISKPDKADLKAFLAQAKKLKRPFYVIIGDRDVNKRKDLSKKEYAKYVHKTVRRHKPKTPNYVFERKGVVFVAVDGAKDVIPSRNGYYKDDVLEWLDATLDLNSNKPVVILQHFPIIPPAQKEGYETFKPEKYQEIISKHNNVKAVIAGHFGVNKEETVDGVTYISTAPVPNYRVIDLIDYEKDTPTIWAEIQIAK